MIVMFEAVGKKQLAYWFCSVIRVAWSVAV